MAVARVKHTITVNGVKRALMLPDFYTNINTLVGVSKDDDDAAEAAEVGDLLRTGRVARIAIRTKKTTSAIAQYRTYNILCLTANIATALAGLPGKTYNGRNITSAGFPRTRKLSY